MWHSRSFMLIVVASALVVSGCRGRSAEAPPETVPGETTVPPPMTTPAETMAMPPMPAETMPSGTMAPPTDTMMSRSKGTDTTRRP